MQIHLVLKLSFLLIDFQNGVIDEGDLIAMGITSESEREVILDAVKRQPCKCIDVSSNICNANEQTTVKVWLKKINLEQYYGTFEKHLYHDMERVKRIWDVELSAVLDIEKVGHRKRMLATVSNSEQCTPGLKSKESRTDFSVRVSTVYIFDIVGSFAYVSELILNVKRR